VRIAGCEVDALRHGMAGHKGVELSGAFSDGQKVREALLRAGQKYGLKAGGTVTYFSASGESGWMAYPTPAVHVAEELRAFREWLPADSWEARVQLGGSFRAANIEGYYGTPWCMGYDRIMKFDHDFIGREALERMAGEPRRTAVSLIWNQDDLAMIARSMYEPGLAAKYIGYPTASYAFQQADQVLAPSGERVGLSQNTNYSINEKQMISLAWLDREHAQIGRDLVLLWGEPDGGSRKPHVERHKQVKVRVKVAAKPYANAVRELRSASLV
jgi:vanillate/3-O-methylgallate O-demethylase